MFEDNSVPLSEFLVLLRFVSTNVGAIGCGKSLIRSMSTACELTVTKGELLSMQGVENIRDAQWGVFVNVTRASGTGNTFKTMCAKLETASKKTMYRWKSICGWLTVQTAGGGDVRRCKGNLLGS